MFGKEILDWTITYVRELEGIEKEKHTRTRDLDKNLLGEILAFMVVGHREISSPFTAKRRHLAKENLEKGKDLYMSGGAPDFVHRKEERRRQQIEFREGEVSGIQ
ncbi:hypothetical protein Godav_004301 [Gossypium davidsonii]|uniref:Uncharacterized protein n=1 Tax=Gossypium davidsonii TaxID=34287 RepID=A0A7J8SL86_GOSDV|nr:hypothetical protein [Gossypium davidsonii]